MIQIHGLTLTASLVVQLISIAIPLVVAFVTHMTAPSWLKGGLHAVLAALTGAVGVLVAANGGYDWQAFVQAILAALATSAVTYVTITRHIGGPQLQQVGLSLGKNLATTLSEDVMKLKYQGRHREVDPHDAPVAPAPTPAPKMAAPKGDDGYAPIYALGYMLIVLGLVGLIIGLIAPHVRSLVSWHWVLGPGIALLVIGAILAFLFGPIGPYRGGPYRRV